MNRRIATRIVLVLALVPAACSEGTELESLQGLTVEARAGRVVLTNTGADAVRYVGLVDGALALVTDPAQWPVLAPSQITELRNDQLIGYTPQATHATILWAVGGRTGEPIEVELR